MDQTRRRYLLSLGALSLAGCSSSSQQSTTQSRTTATTSKPTTTKPTETTTTETTETTTTIEHDYPPPDFDGYLVGAQNYDGPYTSVRDARGQNRVRVRVGVNGDGTGYGFKPAAVHIDPETTVVWEWVDDWTTQEWLTDEAGTFKSAKQSEGTFEHTFRVEGVVKYYSVPHKPLGMRGGIIVGDEYPTEGVRAPDSVDDFLEGAVNYYGWMVDATGQDSVSIRVGLESTVGLEPPAVQVDPGTTVVWQWRGGTHRQDGTHRIVATDGEFDSGTHPSDSGDTFEYTVSDGVYTYVCEPHSSLGVRGAIVTSS